MLLPYGRCEYVRRTAACTKEDRYIPYLSMYLCAAPAARAPLLFAAVAWLLLLFYCLSEVAKTFLVPAVEVRFTSTPTIFQTS